MQKTKETRAGSLKRLIKLVNTLARSCQKKRWAINYQIRNERSYLTINSVGIKKIKAYYKQVYFNKF